jgi:hypothetical protein
MTRKSNKHRPPNHSSLRNHDLPRSHRMHLNLNCNQLSNLCPKLRLELWEPPCHQVSLLVVYVQSLVLTFACIAGNPRDWSVEQVGQWLRCKDLSEYVASFEDNEITGARLAEGLDEETLIKLDVKLPVTRERIQTELKRLFP